MGIDSIVILVLLLISLGFQTTYFLTSKNTTKLYLGKKLLINNNYYLKLDCVDNKIVIILIDESSQEGYKVEDIVEKGFYTYINCENNQFVLNSVTKKIRRS